MSWLMWLALCLLVVAAFVSKFRNARFILLKQNKRREARETGGAEQMLPCEHCHVYIPESEAIHRSGAVFCSKEHSIRHFSY